MDNPILAKLKQEFYESVKRREAMGLPPVETEEHEAEDSADDDEDEDEGYQAEPRRRSRQPRHEREFGPRSGGHQDRFQRGSGRPRGHDSHNGLRQDRHGPGERCGQFQKHERHEDHSAQIDVTGLPQVTGTVRAASDRGFGFLESESGSSYFIPPAPMKKLLHGDKIKAAIRTDAQGRTQAVPLELVEPALKRFVARIRIVRNYVNVVPDHPNMHDYMRTKIAPEIKSHEFKEGDWVICELTTHAMNAKNGYHEALIKEFIASADNPRVPWLVTLRGLDLPLASPPDQGEWVINEKFDRTDLTALPFVTIDSAKTEDMDDALYIEDLGDKWKLTVAIADPTSYVQEGSPTDREAAKRAFTVYLPGCNIPMIPRILSDDICSLREGIARPVLCGTIFADKEGKLDEAATEFFLGTIKSQGKLVYTEVSDYLENGSSPDFVPSDAVASQLHLLQQFAACRKKWRSDHTVLFKDRPDYDFVLDENGALKEIVVENRRTADKIVEECMIAANACCGKFLADKCGKGIFNIHEGFDHNKMEQIKKVITDNGGPEMTEEKFQTKEGFIELKKWIEGQKTLYVDFRLRKFQIPSVIQETPAAHFGLGLDCYATWTSPIRKYGDMVNHRLIKSIITGGRAPTLPDEATLEGMNLAKKTNRNAERGVGDWLYVDYLEKSIGTGEQFTGSIFDVNFAGFRARLAENGAVVFVPGSTICADRTRLKGVYDEGRMYLDGNVLFEVGMDVKLVIAAVNHETRSITANLANAIVIPEKKPEGEAAKNAPAKDTAAEPAKAKPAFNPLEPEAEVKSEAEAGADTEAKAE